MPKWQRRILRTFAVRSRPIAHGYDPLTARPIRSVLVRAANRQPRRQLPVSGKTGMFDFVEAARSRLDPADRARDLQASQMAQGRIRATTADCVQLCCARATCGPTSFDGVCEKDHTLRGLA
jgi:hypothetical protein